MNEFTLIIKPDEEEEDGAEVFVDGTIDGRPYSFLLDTGAARSSVKYDAYTAGFSGTDKHNSSGVFAQSSEDIITVPSLNVGPISKTNVILVRAEEGHPRNISLIGMDLLKDLRCHFQFDSNRVLVEDASEFDAEYPVQDLFLDKGAHPYVDVEFGAVTAQAVWDTGASITIVDETFLKEHPDLFQLAGYSTGIDATGTSVQTPMYRLAESRIGGRVFPPVRVAAVDLSYVNATIERPMNLILGYSTYSQANWIFDFPRKKWAISKWLGA
ncbi:MAG: aspartyl protease family protein [Anaerolineae bacterium]|nr:aspartyl protease family protein [Anaerolineae bacterium]